MNSIVKKISFTCLLLCGGHTATEIISIDSKEHFKRCLKPSSCTNISAREQVNSALISNIAVTNIVHEPSTDNPEPEHRDDDALQTLEPANPYTMPVEPALPPEVETSEPFKNKAPAFIPTVASTKPSVKTDAHTVQASSTHGFFATLSDHIKHGALYLQEKITTTFAHS